MLLAVRDETTTGQSLYELSIEFLTERITVRELIRERVQQEVRHFNRKIGQEFRGLVQPVGTEQIRNGRDASFRFEKPRELDVGEQVARAFEGFSSNGFFILIDDQQAESLEQEFPIGPATRVRFVKLFPLIGG